MEDLKIAIQVSIFKALHCVIATDSDDNPLFTFLGLYKGVKIKLNPETHRRWDAWN